ncbi:RIP metalloprotease RseP [Craterilacuibacter sp.]|uniref:RIP metalloprotease RseP n=1 Tax=Craterilacuibacter sp. TaxID=2870909 RepID=UPI003F3B61AA
MMTVLAFLLAIAVLVTFHEYGHYQVARWCGVRVLRFSIGFGKPLLRMQRGDTEWVLAAIPLGGYVKMLDEREGDVNPADRHLAFNTQSVYKRIAIVVAGPLANFLMAIALFWVVLLPGGQAIHPLVGTVVQQSAAAAAGAQPGDRILAINGQTTPNWEAISDAVSQGIASEGKLELSVEQFGVRRELSVDLPRFGLDQLDEKSLGKLGLMPARYLPKIAMLEPDGAGAKAGLKVGDTLLAMDGVPVKTWADWVQVVQNHPGKAMQLSVARGGQTLDLTLRPDTVMQGGVALGRIGAAPEVDRAWSQALVYPVDYTPLQALTAALGKTWNMSVTTLSMMGGMLFGQVSLDAISGPFTIADYAGKSAVQGWQSYLAFMAVISISLGVLNLLPVPVLDGGHLLYYVAEIIRGRPLSEQLQQLGQRIGFAIILALMVLALFNDLGRLLGG